MLLNINDVISIITIIQFTFFVSFLFLFKKGNKKSNYIFAFFLITQILYNLERFIVHKGSPGPEMISLGMFFVSTELLFGALIYFYVQSVLFSDFKFSNKMLIHTIPFFVNLILILIDYYLDNFFWKQKLFLIIDGIFSRPLSLIYLLAAAVQLIKYKAILKEKKSDATLLKWNWLNTIVFLFFMNRFINEIFVASYYMGYEINIPDYLCICFILIVSSAIVFYGLLKNEVFQVSHENAAEKYQKTKISDENLNSILLAVEKNMETHKLFLDPSLSIEDLAEKTGIQSHLISQAINSKLGMNFFNYINNYRIEESKKLLNEENDKTIQEIFYQSGFSSKSTFNKIFKNFTGLTPSEYKNQKKM